MCLTIEALYVFVSMLSPELIDVDDGMVRVNAATGPVTYEKMGEMWCNERPSDEQTLQLVFGEPA